MADGAQTRARSSAGGAGQRTGGAVLPASGRRRVGRGLALAAGTGAAHRRRPLPDARPRHRLGLVPQQDRRHRSQRHARRGT